MSGFPYPYPDPAPPIPPFELGMAQLLLVLGPVVVFIILQWILPEEIAELKIAYQAWKGKRKRT